MFTLDIDTIPLTTAELSELLNRAIHTWIQLPAGAVPVTALGDLPSLEALSVDVTNGVIRSTHATPFSNTASNEAGHGITVLHLHVKGEPIVFTGIPVQIALQATRSCFSYVQSSPKQLQLNLVSAHQGYISLKIRHGDLEQAVLTIARRYAGDAITLTKIDVSLDSVSPTQVKVLLTITAKKFVTAVIRVSGFISIDDTLIARATGLKAAGDGMVAGIAVGMIQPHLNKLEGTPLPLTTFSLGNVRLRDVGFDTTDGLSVRATFAGEAT